MAANKAQTKTARAAGSASTKSPSMRRAPAAKTKGRNAPVRVPADAPVITLPLDWAPRPDQRALWDYLESGGKRAVMVAHRRWGKDEVGLHFAAVAALQRPGNYWHMLPQYGQARRVIWEAVNPRTGRRRIDEAFPQEIRRRTIDGEMLIELANGSTWQLVGSDNFDSLVGSPPVGIVFSEYALADPMAWAYFRPILAENGGWALFIYTPRGRNHGKTLYDFARSEEGWFSQRPARSRHAGLRPRRARAGAARAVRGVRRSRRRAALPSGIRVLLRGDGARRLLREAACRGPLRRAHRPGAPRGRPRGLHVLGLGHGRFDVHLVHAGDRARSCDSSTITRQRARGLRTTLPY